MLSIALLQHRHEFEADVDGDREEDSEEDVDDDDDEEEEDDDDEEEDVMLRRTMMRRMMRKMLRRRMRRIVMILDVSASTGFEACHHYCCSADYHQLTVCLITFWKVLLLYQLS